MASVKVDIVCPCGRLYQSKMVSGNQYNRQSGSGTCSGCKKKFEWQISGTNVYTNYKK